MKTVIALALLAASATASDYVFRDGYYWRGSQAYTRYSQPTYSYHNGCRYQTTSYYYTPVDHKEPVKETYKAPEKPTLPSVTDENWRAKLLEFAGQRDKWRADLKASALEHNEFMEAVKVLGLEGYDGEYVPRYATSPYGFGSTGGYGVKTSGYGGYNTYKKEFYFNPLADQGNTVYGYSYSNLADVYGATDLQALYQQASRLTENAQSLAGNANSGFQSLVDKEGDARARVAAILAKAQLLRSLDVPEKTVETRTQSFSAGNTAQSQAVIDRMQHGGAADLQSVITKNCVTCHSASTPQGKSELFPDGVNMEAYAGFTYPQRQQVLLSVLQGKMPKNGTPLGVSDLALFVGDVQAHSLLQNQGPAKADRP